jgi:glyoxylase-like metal-dependent hydrolase (beta-lactamase superfamily II)
MKMLSWLIGEIRITQIIEIEAGAVLQETIPDALPERIKNITWLFPHFADESGNLKGVVQAFLVESAGKRLLVDTCVGNGKNRVDLPAWNNLQTNFLAVLKEAGCDPAEVDKVVCTHLHFDHVGWNTSWDGKKWIPTFPKAEYLFAKQEFEYWDSNPSKEIQDDRSGIDDSVRPLFGAGQVSLVSLDAEPLPGVTLIPTPGHTPHHVSVLIRSQNASAVITGDAMHHPCQVAHPEWHTLADTDQNQAHHSRREFLTRFSGTPTLVLGSHFAQPTGGYIVSEQNGYRFDTTRPPHFARSR